MIIFLFAILFTLFIIKRYLDKENFVFELDALHIPENPVDLNEIDVRRYYRTIGIDKHAKLDKYNNIEKILYGKPKPEMGETRCFPVNCPYWINNIVCWKCV